MEQPKRREPEKPDGTQEEECLVCEHNHIDREFASPYLPFQCQDGEDLLEAVKWWELQRVKDILRRSPKCIYYMGREIWRSGTLFQCEHGNTITER